MFCCFPLQIVVFAETILKLCKQEIVGLCCLAPYAALREASAAGVIPTAILLEKPCWRNLCTRRNREKPVI